MKTPAPDQAPAIEKMTTAERQAFVRVLAAAALRAALDEQDAGADVDDPDKRRSG